MADIIIAGLGSAGYAAMMAVKKINSRASITVIDPKSRDLVHSCGFPYSLEGLVSEERLEQDLGLDRMGVTRIRAIAERIDLPRKTLICSGEDGTHEIAFEKLILATGYKPILPPISGLDRIIGKGLHTLSNIGDLKRIRPEMARNSSAIVVGAGAIGLETAWALHRSGLRVAVFEMKDQVLPGVLDPDLAGVAESVLVSMGLELRKKCRVDAVTGADKFTGIRTGGEEIEAGLGILAAGFEANSDLARKSGLDCGGNGVLVDRMLRTSCPDVFAAGDCASGWSVIDGKTLRAKLATSAYKQGAVAGVNAAGRELTYAGSAGTFVTRIGDLEIAGTGYTTSVAQEHGWDVVTGKINAGIRPEYYPGNESVLIKILFDRKTRIILGGQAVGRVGAAERINLVSFAIEFKIPVDEFSRLEMAYCPAVSEVYDPLLRAVDIGLRRA